MTRVVEYDISSGTQAAFMRDFGSRPWSTVYTGGVTKTAIDRLGRCRWPPSLGSDETIAVSEVDPDRVTSALFHMNMWGGGWDFETPSVYREPEADVKIPPARCAALPYPKHDCRPPAAAS